MLNKNSKIINITNKFKLNTFLIEIQGLQNNLIKESEEVVQIKLFKSNLDGEIYKILEDTEKEKMDKILLKIKEEYKKKVEKSGLIVLDLIKIKPNFLDFDMKALIIWIENVKVNEKLLKEESNKKYYHLLVLYQKEKDKERKKSILLKLLKKIESYNYYKYKDK